MARWCHSLDLATRYLKSGRKGRELSVLIPAVTTLLVILLGEEKGKE